MNSTSPTPSRLLVINAGSSSIRWALYEEENRFAFGKGEYLTKEARWVFESEIEGAKSRKELPHSNTSAAVDFLLTWLETKQLLASVTAIGHRLVHGMERKAPALLTSALLEELTRLIPYDPEHLPLEFQGTSKMSWSIVFEAFFMVWRLLIKSGFQRKLSLNIKPRTNS